MSNRADAEVPAVVNPAPRPQHPPASGPTPSHRPRRGSRLAIAVFLCLTGLGYFLYQHYRFSWPLIQLTPRGLAALSAYEFGYYRQAASLWREMAGLGYEPAALPQLLQMASEDLAKDPGRLQNYLSLADLYLAFGDVSRAGTTYEQALQRDPEASDAAIGLASVRLLQGRYPEARALLDPVFDRGVVERDLPTFLNFLLALDALRHAPGPASADGSLTLAYAYRYLAVFDPRQSATVLRYATRTLQLDPAQDAAYFCAGLAYMKQDQLDRAIQEFAHAVQLNPRNAEAYNRLGFLYGKRGQPDKELAFYRQAVAAAPDNPSYAHALGLVLQKKYGDLPQAVAAFRQARALRPTHYGYAMALAVALAQLRQCPEAMAIYDALVRAHPDVAEAALFRAQCLVSLRRYEEAVAALERVKSRQPLPAWAARELAYAYSKLDRREAAIAAEEEAIQRVPHDVDTLYDLQANYRRVGRYADAYRVVRQIMTLEPDHPGARRVLPYLERNVAR